MSLLFIAEHVPRLVVKGVFSCLLLCFALTLFGRIYGGVASGLVGSGADIAVFAVLIMVYNANLQKATATSVLIMAVTSVVSSLINYYVLEAVTTEIKAYLLAAIPVVVVGAPLGAYVCSKMKSGQLIALLLLLIALKIVFTFYELLQY